METVGSPDASILRSRDFHVARWNSLKPWREGIEASGLAISNRLITPQNFPFESPSKPQSDHITLAVMGFREVKSTAQVDNILRGSFMDPADLGDLVDWDPAEHYREIFKEDEDRVNYSLILLGSAIGSAGNRQVLRYHEGAVGPSLDLVPLGGNWSPEDHLFLCRSRIVSEQASDTGPTQQEGI